MAPRGSSPDDLDRWMYDPVYAWCAGSKIGEAYLIAGNFTRGIIPLNPSRNSHGIRSASENHGGRHRAHRAQNYPQNPQANGPRESQAPQNQPRETLGSKGTVVNNSTVVSNADRRQLNPGELNLSRQGGTQGGQQIRGHEGQPSVYPTSRHPSRAVPSSSAHTGAVRVSSNSRNSGAVPVQSPTNNGERSAAHPSNNTGNRAQGLGGNALSAIPEESTANLRSHGGMSGQTVAGQPLRGQNDLGNRATSASRNRHQSLAPTLASDSGRRLASDEKREPSRSGQTVVGQRLRGQESGSTDRSKSWGRR